MRPKNASKPTAAPVHTAPALSDVVPARLRLMQYDRLRAQNWKNSHTDLAPNIEIAYGLMIAEFLDNWEAMNRPLLDPSVKRPSKKLLLIGPHS